MKLTKDQRFTAYCIMLHEIRSYDARNICHAAKYLFELGLDDDFRFSNLKEYFPELWRKRKRGKNEESVYLWSSQEDRIKALEKCITETSNF